MSEYHFVGGDDKPYGPYSLEKMRTFFSQNRLSPESKVKRDGGEFQPAASFPEITSSSSQIEPFPSPQTPQSPAGQSPAVTATPYSPGQAHVPSQAQKPGKVQAISIMVLVSGIMATLAALGWLLGTFCLWIPAFYGLVHGIMAIIKGSQLLGSDPGPAYLTVRTTAIMAIVNIINCDMLGMTCGIVILTFLGDPEVRAYMRLPAR